MAASEAVRDVAGMAAVLPLPAAIDREFLPAVRADVGMRRLVLHQIEVAVPPRVPALVGAESLAFPAGNLCDGPAAVLAHRAAGTFTGQMMPPAPGLYSIDGDMERFGNPAVASTVTAHDRQLSDLFIRHNEKPPGKNIF